MFKRVFSVVGGSAVAAALCIGCGGDDNPANSGGNNLVGDWSEEGTTYLRVKSTGDSVVDNRKMLDGEKFVISFTSDNDIVNTEFYKFADFWIEHGASARYGIRGDTVCIAYAGELGDECYKYDVSGNNLTVSSERTECYDGECEYRSTAYKYVRANLASIKKSLDTVYSRDPALNHTEWTRSSGSGGENENLYFGYEFYDRNDVYISGDYDESTWYTDDGRVSLVGLGCDKWERLTFDDGGYEEYCASYFVVNKVTIPYLLADGTLRLRPTGSSGWDVWTPYEHHYYSQPKSKAKSTPERAKRPANPFFKAFRR